ncbi:FG-GAP-like repeat-containing protein [uncultured Kordia sp.]|uniref:FG-GAP-like repeat-containing protein n=1 Tax=uncultured Kordia sp. TaxID=507699 RepID=UPI002620E8F0|nr:FG-GAP-like repeat-containing protein [uncultured Kordia sp.]
MKKITLLICLIASCFFTVAQTTVDCSLGAVNTTYCYTNDDLTSFVFVSSDGSDLVVTFNSGQVENEYDELIILDTNGSQIYNGYGNNGDLSGLTFQSSGDTITVSINSDFAINCTDNGYTQWDFDVSCATCANPSVTYNIVNDCDNSGGFFIDIDITDIGSATSLTVSDNQGSATQATAATILQFGPYTNSTDVIISIQNDQDINCTVNSGSITQVDCSEPPGTTFTTSTVSTSGSQRAAVDMNGDFLDDVVSITNSNINIFYQESSGGLSTSATNIVTTTADNIPSWSLAAADYDRNGYTDLLYGGQNGVTFMRANNNGTAFTEISGSQYVFSQRSNFVDLNQDGNLDAFVCHDVDPNVYYMNDGSGNLTFNQGGLGDDEAGGNYGSIWIDYDNDRDMDMFIAKCRGGATTININEMHENDGSGNFTEVASTLGLADPIQTWSSAWGDFDNDGDMDVFVGASSTANGTHKLMRNNGNSTFTDVTSTSGILPAFTNTGHENATYDFDNDGNLDIASNGSILFGNGDLTFTVHDNMLGITNGSFGDMNNDGFIDAILGTNLYTNDTNSNNWVKITTTGVASNINGIGARVELHTASGVQIRDVRSGEGFRYMSTLNTHFGIGTETEITNLIIYWPSGTIDNIMNPAINTHHIITEGQALSVEDETLFQNITIHPNPVGNLMNIDSPVNLIGKIATIFNIEGKRMMNLKLEENKIDVSSLRQGNYILRLESNGKVHTQKFIKQ